MEIRVEQDRRVAEGDRLVLEERDPRTPPFTEWGVIVVVTVVLRDQSWVPDGYAAMSIRLEEIGRDPE